MRNKIITYLLMSSIVTMSLAACGKNSGKGGSDSSTNNPLVKIVHCDNCGEEVKVDLTSKMDDSWTIYCEKCNKELGIEEKMLEVIENG